MSNDLNLLLKARVVKLRAELDTSKTEIAKMKKQVDGISTALEDKPVKLKVKLQATVADLTTQLNTLSKKLATSKTNEGVKIGVQIDVNGSAKKIEKQLKEVHDTVNKFNKEYGEQLKDMEKLRKKSEETEARIKKTSNANISTKTGAQNFNNMKEYVKALSDAEKHLKSTLAKGKQGFFSSKELKDAQGNLHGFTATLQKMNGVVESVSYKFDESKQRFQIMDRKTVTATERNLDTNKKALLKLQNELKDTGKQAGDLYRELERLSEEGDLGRLDTQMVENYKYRVKQAKLETIEAEKKKKIRQDELLLMRKIMDASKGSNTSFNPRTGDLIKKLSQSDGSSELLKQSAYEFKILKKEIEDSKKAVSEKERVTKRATVIEAELTKFLREEVDTSKELSSENLRLLISRTKVADNVAELNKLEKKLAEVRRSSATTKDLQAREDAYLKLRKIMLQNAEIQGKASGSVETYLARVKSNESATLAVLNDKIRAQEIINKKRREELEISRLNVKANSYIKEDNGFSNQKLNALIDKGDFNDIREYIAQTQKLDLALAKVSQNSKGITTITGTLKSTGKTTKQVTYEVDALTKKLRYMGSQDVFNRNANLGIFEQLKIAMARVPVWMTSMTAFYGTIQSVQAMTTEVLKLDKAMTELRRVASSSINMDIMFEGAVSMSGELGANMHDVLNTMGEMARTFGDFNERQLLAITNTATLMANVSDLTVEEAGNNLVGTMNAFNLEAEDSIRIADSLNEVDNNYAISTKQLAEGLSKSASTARTFGASLEENIGHITAIGAVTMESGAIIGELVAV